MAEVTTCQLDALDAELCTLLPERETLMFPIFPIGITIDPIITVTPVVVVGNAIAVQAGTIGSYVTATLFQSLNL